MSEKIHEDHPHAYGDKFFVPLVYRSPVGSSPRVWGQVGLAVFFLSTCRIIPTRMGTRHPPCSLSWKPQDHPHAYGDKKEPALFAYPFQGSSPRVWGQDLAVPRIYEAGRIIPTRMGTSRVYPPCGGSQWDHPHAYGDK